MGHKPSDRHKVELDEPQLNLNSMMDLFAVLIPALLMMSAVVEVSVINVSAPAIGGSDSATPPPAPDKPPLNLTVTITDKGFIVAGSGGVLSGSGVTPVPNQPQQGPTIPVVQRNVICSRFRGTWPPPRSKNRDQKRCEKPEENRSFWIYDLQALTKKILEIKDAFPEERRIVIVAEPDIEYEAVIDVMDATRDIKEPGGETRALFDEAVLSPGLF
jgi:biopolymer transport protein TolR